MRGVFDRRRSPTAALRRRQPVSTRFRLLHGATSRRWRDVAAFRPHSAFHRLWAGQRLPPLAGRGARGTSRPRRAACSTARHLPLLLPALAPCVSLPYLLALFFGVALPVRLDPPPCAKKSASHRDFSSPSDGWRTGRGPQKSRREPSDFTLLASLVAASLRSLWLGRRAGPAFCEKSARRQAWQRQQQVRQAGRQAAPPP